MAELEADNLRLAQNTQDIDISDETQDFRVLNIFSKCAAQMTHVPFIC
jgi:tRNA-splicing endonuclease subunit Sen54